MPENLSTEQVSFISTQPVTVRAGLARSFAKTASPRAAIKAMCLSCCHSDRDEVAHCTVMLCPLHAYRPFQGRLEPQPAVSGTGQS